MVRIPNLGSCRGCGGSGVQTDNRGLRVKCPMCGGRGHESDGPFWMADEGWGGGGSDVTGGGSGGDRTYDGDFDDGGKIY